MFTTEMFGRLVAGLIVIGLAFGVWILWPRAEDGPPPTTQVVASSTTSLATTTTTQEEITTTAGPTAAVIETVEQAADLLREFWFGWFEGIYNQDEDRIKDVVASQAQLDAARSAFGNMTFSEEPTVEGVHLTDIEILQTDSSCTAIWATLSVDFRTGSSAGVHVFRISDGNWKSVHTWVNRNDLWEQDCDAQLEPLS